MATEGAALLDLVLVAGFLLNVWLVDRWGRMRLQIVGFAGMTLGLVVLAHGASVDAAGGHATPIIFAGFVLFNLLMNAGPNATTFILPAELFSTEVRASGHGFAAGAAKLGAALGILVLPLLRARIGVPNVLYALALVCLLGLAITVVFHVETKGRPLEELDPTD
jgi:MFS family permease